MQLLMKLHESFTYPDYEKYLLYLFYLADKFCSVRLPIDQDLNRNRRI